MSGSVPILVIYGETATGKTAVAVELAERLGGEIVNADSMQVYRGMDIGTAKPSPEERARAVFHLLDIADPLEPYSAGKFKADADRAIADIRARGRVAIVAGGTGLYLKVLCSGIIDGPPLDRAFRDRLKAEEAAYPGSLFKRLSAADPDKAGKISPNDTIRLIRALEVLQTTGTRLSSLQNDHRFAERTYRPFKVGLRVERTNLRRRIEERVDDMMAQGFVDEVRDLMRRGATSDTPAMGAVGYTEMMAHINGELSMEVAVERTVQSTWRLTKKQRTWFRADPDIVWFDWPDDHDSLLSAVDAWAERARGTGPAQAEPRPSA